MAARTAITDNNVTITLLSTCLYVPDIGGWESSLPVKPVFFAYFVLLTV